MEREDREKILPERKREASEEVCQAARDGWSRPEGRLPEKRINLPYPLLGRGCGPYLSLSSNRAVKGDG